MTFLIVDDNETMRKTIKKVIARDGDEFIECSDGKDVLPLYEQHHPDWVLMDIGMKEVTGIEATESILAADPNAKVIIVTDYGDKFFQKAAKEAGAKDFVLKENLFDIETIIRKSS